MHTFAASLTQVFINFQEDFNQHKENDEGQHDVFGRWRRNGQSQPEVNVDHCKRKAGMRTRWRMRINDRKLWEGDSLERMNAAAPTPQWNQLNNGRVLSLGPGLNSAIMGWKMGKKKKKSFNWSWQLSVSLQLSLDNLDAFVPTKFVQLKRLHLVDLKG